MQKTKSISLKEMDLEFRDHLAHSLVIIT